MRQAFCRNCGKTKNENAAICLSCGVHYGVGSGFCGNCGQSTDAKAVVCVHCGVSLTPSLSGKSKMTAGLLGLLLGGFGVHRFYLGNVGIGIAQIAVTLITCGAGALWGFIEGILILAGEWKDKDGNPLRD